MATKYLSAVFNYKSNVDESKDGVQGEVDSVLVSSTSAAWCSQHEELNGRITALEERFRKADLFNAAADLITPVYNKILDADIDLGLPSYVTLGLLLDTRREYSKQYLANALQALTITTADFNRMLRIYISLIDTKSFILIIIILTQPFLKE